MTGSARPGAARGEQRRLRGSAWVFRGILDVDWEICSYALVRDLQRKGILTYEQLGPYCMVNVDPGFPRKVRPGDFIVAGENMGYGHDHDHACMSIRGAGVGAVLCESAAPYFLRNSIDHGLPVLEVPGVTSVVTFVTRPASSPTASASPWATAEVTPGTSSTGRP